MPIFALYFTPTRGFRGSYRGRVRSLEVGEMDARAMVVYPFQWGSKNLPRSELCVDGGCVRRSQDVRKV
jgi:hypothetical protein